MSPAKTSMPNEPDFIRRVREREASISIGASTARNMGEGTVKQARDFLRNLDLPSFTADSEEVFLARLDESTDKLKESLSYRSWGAARKFLNIFLRGAFYNRFLCDYYAINVLEQFLEVPLDKSVAQGLNGERNGETLPRWKTILRLHPQESAVYQAFARSVAREKQCARVHLDLWYWRREEPAGAVLPEKANVHVVVPGVREGGLERVVYIPSPRLVHPDQASDFVKGVVDLGKGE